VKRISDCCKTLQNIAKLCAWPGWHGFHEKDSKSMNEYECRAHAPHVPAFFLMLAPYSLDASSVFLHQ